MTWSVFPQPVEFQGRRFEGKGPEFERILDLPKALDRDARLAVGGKTAPLERLARHGWRVVDGPQATLSPEQYRDFIQGSYGELTVAKDIYAALETGWFSERSACYLAAGRPVVARETGFSRVLPTGEGLLAFETPEEAAEAVAEVSADYDRHAAAAARIAREHFDAERVLARLLEDVGSLGASPRS
jgi:glycosyltransferase involved in cell wall biosynthesis